MSTETNPHVDVAIIGAGSVGIAVAYYLVVEQGIRNIALIDPRDPLSLTSAQSGENYRNWWPHPVMTAFTDHSTGLMEAIDRQSGGRLNMTRGGYALVTRRSRPEDLIESLYRGYEGSPHKIRIRDGAANDYQPALRTPWTAAPGGVDVLVDQRLIQRHFPSLANDAATVIHIRRAGSISTQQMGQFMLEAIKARGARVMRAEVAAIDAGTAFSLELDRLSPELTNSGLMTQNRKRPERIHADRIVNAAGPYLRDISRMLGEDLPVSCVFQQKILFEDRAGAIARDLPFTIDLDGQSLWWTDEDRALLASEPATRHLTEAMPGGIHCRPDGAVDGTWIKLGWAFNGRPSDPHDPDPIDTQFPDTVLRGASRLHPKLAAYIGHLPRGAHHYGGYYTMTDENWPLIGPMKTARAFVAGALSGFGSMAACATGSLCAAWVAGKPVPEYAKRLSLSRLNDAPFLAELASLGKGSL